MEKQLRLKRNNIPKNEIINIVITLVFFILNIILLQYHETWLDEIQAWGIAKSHNVFEIYSLCKIEGHPMMWYLILRPFALLGFPIKVMNVISIIFMTLAVYVLIKYIDAKLWLKVLLVFGGLMFYYNAVNARTYSLVCLAMVLIAVTYKNRKEHPYKYNLQLLLLTQTHILTCGFIAGFWLVEVYEMIKDFGIKGSFVKKEARNRLYSLLIYSFGIVWLLTQLAGVGVPKSSFNNLVFDYKKFGDYQIVGKVVAGILVGLPVIICNALLSVLYQVRLVALSFNLPNVDLVYQFVQQQILPLILAAVIQIMLYIHLWNIDKKKLFIVYLGITAASLISFLITSMTISRLLIVLFGVYILQIQGLDSDTHSVGALNKIQTVVFLSLMLIYGMQMAYRQIDCSFGMDVKQFEEYKQYCNDDTVIVNLDDNLDNAQATIIQFMFDRDYYYIYDKTYKNHMSLYGYDIDAYMTDGQSNETPKIIQDFVDFVKENKLDPSNILIPMFVGEDIWKEDSGGNLRYQVLKEYFNVEEVSYWDIDTFVMQLDPMDCCRLVPNEKLLSLMS